MSKFQVTKGIINNLNNVPYTEGQVYFVYNDINSENLDIYADIDGVRRKIESKSGYDPSLSVTRADALTGADITAQWALRKSTGSGSATVRSVQGATVVWNQLNNNTTFSGTTSGVTFTKNTSDNSWTLSGTATDNTNKILSVISCPADHKLLVKGCIGGSASTYYMGIGGSVTDEGSGGIVTSGQVNYLRVDFKSGTDFGTGLTIRPQVFDLTAMFGAGNEPATVAEFERMYPEPYYPYSAPTLKPVQISGIHSMGFNLWDEQWEVGGIYSDTGGNNNGATNHQRSKNYIPVFPSTTYYIKCPNQMNLCFYDYNKSYLGLAKIRYKKNQTFVTAANAYYMRFVDNAANGWVGYNHDICINISNPALNGTYKPYMTDSVEWPTQTLRAAGSVRDMLYSDHVDVRVGELMLTGNELVARYNYTSYTGYMLLDVLPQTGVRWAYSSSDFGTAEHGTVIPNTTQFAWLGVSNRALYLHWADCPYATAADLSAWLAQRYAAGNPVTFYYELATPTATPISPALPMSYKVERGGTESIVVPEGEISAAPVLTVAEGESASELVMDALAAIATPDGPTATVNHAANTYLTMGGKLYKVTRAIASGEQIVSGTNVTETTVMAEVLSLIQ